MKELLFLLAFFIAYPFGVKAQVSPPSDLTMAVIPLLPIDLAGLTEAQREEPLTALSDTSRVAVSALFELSATVNMASAHFQVIAASTGLPILDTELPLSGDMPAGYERFETDGFFNYSLGAVPYSGGLQLKVRVKDASGSYSSFVSEP